MSGYIKHSFLFLLLFFTMLESYSQPPVTTPPYLEKGDTVAIVATARSFQPEDLGPALDSLRKWGLNVVIGKTIGPQYHQLAGTDKARARDLQNMLDDPTIKAVWAARGGYGTVRIVDMLDFTKFRQKPKWIIGYSDITVLHSHIHNMGIATLHATMPINVKRNSEEAIQSFKQALFGKNLKYTVPSRVQNRMGTAEGELVGGNLSILYSLLGSPSAIHTDGKILFIEDLDEYLYHVDRMMMNLKRNGYFDNLKGLIVGGLTKMHDNSIPWGKDAIGIVKEIADTYGFPVCFDFPAGHTKDNRALIMGRKVKLTVGKNTVSLKFKDSK